MICSYCGYESNRDYQYCPQCGAVIEKKEQEFYTPPQAEFNQTDFTYEAPAPQPEHKIVTALKDKLYLIICILASVCCGLSVISGGLPAVRIFLTVYLWIGYTQAKNNTLNPNHIRNISGTVYASYILNNVLGVFIIIGGLGFSVGMSYIMSNEEMLNLFYKELEIASGSEAVSFFSKYLASFAGLIGIIMTVIGIVLIVINIVGRKTIHKFVKSLYLNMGMPTEQIQKASKAHVWLIVFGVLNAVSALSTNNPLLLLAELSFAAALIITSILIKKYFSEKKTEI